MRKWLDDMDQECISLCDAINHVPSIETIESCCGHGKQNFRVWFFVGDLRFLPIILFYCDPCHIGFRWDCRVKTDCAMSPVTFYIESNTIGDEAYQEADIIAKAIKNFLFGIEYEQWLASINDKPRRYSIIV